jgi:hypothetical protein
MKNAIKNAIALGATSWADCSESEVAAIILEWLSDSGNVPEIGEACAEDGLILADLLKASFSSSLSGAGAAAVGACVMDIVRRAVMSEAKHMFKEIQWEQEGV